MSLGGAASAGLGVVLCSAGALHVPAAAGRQKIVAAAVMALSLRRFAVTADAEVTGTQLWATAAGGAGLVLAAASLYAAFAFELEEESPTAKSSRCGEEARLPR